MNLWRHQMSHDHDNTWLHENHRAYQNDHKSSRSKNLPATKEHLRFLEFLTRNGVRDIHDTRWRNSQSHMSGFSSNKICSLSPGGYGSGSKTSGWTFANQLPVRSKCVSDTKPEKPVIPINAILFRSKFNVTRFSMSLKSPSGIVESSLDERSRLVTFFIPTKQFDSRIHIVLKTYF